MIRARVARAERTTDHFITVTVSGPELAGFEFLGRDQCVRVFLRRPGQERLVLPDADDDGWYPQYRDMGDDTRPYVRNYTIRRFDPEALELDIEFVAHGDGGPASTWAISASEGDEVGLFPEGIYYLPPAEADWHLLVGDESAVPALLSIVEQAPRDLRAKVYLEVPSPQDVRQLDVPPGVEVHWLPREDAHATPGRLALETVSAADLPEGRPYCWVAGENALPTGLRRALVRDRAVSKDDITFVGYWRAGVAGVD
ncbi:MULTISPECIES: siderophore-interacting protein [Nocardiopsis]|uniref:siderophore-interacting protein n=1 Tax=Nocardiopsis TaxID=2013 RepID=UPI0003476AE2|nr:MULTISPECIES: siderophore-interacting protein [Nocardiopsis]PWV47257.1 NADPH-dependent ferric siderophore reductase [Nocardiopsis sp. L17-MgMaSL7]